MDLSIIQDKTIEILPFIDFELFSSVKWTKESPTKRSSWTSQAQAFAGQGEKQSNEFYWLPKDAIIQVYI